MTNLMFRLSLLVCAALLPAAVLGALAAVNPHHAVWLMALGAAAAPAAALLGADVLVRRPVLRLLAAAERLRDGHAAAEAADRSPFQRIGAALEAAAAGREWREAALVEQEARLRLALGAAEIGVFEIDVAGNRVWHDGRAAAMTGPMLPAETWVAQTDPRVRALLLSIHPEDRPTRRARLSAVIAGRAETYGLTYRVRGSDGAWRWIVERGGAVARAPGTGAPLRIVGVLRDVTEQYEDAERLERAVAERTAALRESERRFRAMFDSAFQLTALLTRDGVLLEANRATLAFFGRTQQQMVGRPLWEAGAWGRDSKTAADIRAHLARAATGAFVRLEATLADAAGRQATLDVSIQPILDEGGAVSLLLVEGRDISERVELQAQLAHSQKMEAVGQLTGGVAHDFNNVLQALTGNLELLHRLAVAREDARLLDLVNKAKRATARGTRLTKQLLAFSRRQNLRPEYLRASRLIADMADMLRRAAGDAVTVHLPGAPDLWTCRVDAGQFESALLNLVINARDAMPEGGTIAITAANTVLDAAAAASLDVSPGEYVRVDVADSGTGIAPENLARMFEPFFTTKAPGKGTGLGLAMVHGFVRQSGGGVAVASELGKGTTISLLLPRREAETREAEAQAKTQAEAWTGGEARAAQAKAAPANAPQPPARHVAAPSARGDGLGILVVEDDPDVREAVQFALADAGHSVMTAGGAEAALAILRDSPKLDLLVCDVALPGALDGLAIAEEARRQRPDLRVLLATGYGADGSPAGGGFEVMAKPFTQAELLRRVAKICATATAA